MRSTPAAWLVLLAAMALPAVAVAAPTPVAAPATTAAAAVAAQDANALVREALDSPRRVSYVGQMQTIRWGTRMANATIQRVEHLAPASTRRTFLAPEALYGEYDITVGTTTTKFDPKAHRAMISENPSSDNVATMNSNITLLAENYRAVIGPVEIVAARPATSISLVNKFSGERMMRLWIDNETKVVLAKEAYHQDGSLAWRSRFDEIRYTNEIPNGIFITSIPSGFVEVEGRKFADLTDDMQHAIDEAGFKPVNPKYLPDGFHMIGAENSSMRGMRNLHLLYSDGIRSLSLFENNADSEPDFGGVKPSVTHFEGHDAQYVKDGPTTLLTWRERGIAFALIGDLDLKKLTAIAISVVP